MKATKKPAKPVAASAWKKLHDAFVDPKQPPWEDFPTLEALCARFRIPLLEAKVRSAQEEWAVERSAIKSRRFLEGDAPGAKTENEYVLRRALNFGSLVHAFPDIGGREQLESVIADSRVVWRRHMAHVLLWEAIQELRRVRHGSTKGQVAA